jgi:hypothetical protein
VSIYRNKKSIPLRTLIGALTPLGVVILFFCIMGYFAIQEQRESGKLAQKNTTELIELLNNYKNGGQYNRGSLMAALSQKKDPIGAKTILDIVVPMVGVDDQAAIKYIEIIWRQDLLYLEPFIYTLGKIDPDYRLEQRAKIYFFVLKDGKGKTISVNPDPVNLIVSLFGSKAFSSLALSLKSNNTYLKANAAETLGYLDNASIPDLLLPLLRDQNWKVRRAAIIGLMSYGTYTSKQDVINITQKSIHIADLKNIAQDYNIFLSFHEVKAFIQLTIQSLEKYGSREMAQALLNLPQGKRAAAVWAENNGYTTVEHVERKNLGHLRYMNVTTYTLVKIPFLSR